MGIEPITDSDAARRPDLKSVGDTSRPTTPTHKQRFSVPKFEYLQWRGEVYTIVLNRPHKSGTASIGKMAPLGQVNSHSLQSMHVVRFMTA